MDLHYYQRSINHVLPYFSLCSFGASSAGRGGGDPERRQEGRQRDPAVPLRPGGGQSVQRQVVQGTQGVLPLHAQGESARADLFCAGRPDQCEWGTCTGDASLDVEGYPLRNTSNCVSFYFLPILLLLP